MQSRLVGQIPLSRMDDSTEVRAQQADLPSTTRELSLLSITRSTHDRPEDDADRACIVAKEGICDSDDTFSFTGEDSGRRCHQSNQTN